MSEIILHEWTGSYKPHYNYQEDVDGYEFVVPYGMTELIVGCTFVLDSDAKPTEAPIVAINPSPEIDGIGSDKEFQFGLSSPGRMVIPVSPGQIIVMLMPPHGKGPWVSSNNELTSYYFAQKLTGGISFSMDGAKRDLSEFCCCLTGIKLRCNRA